LDFSDNQFSDSSLFNSLHGEFVNLNNNPFQTFTGSFLGNVSLSSCPFLTSCSIGGDQVSLSENPQLIHANVGSQGVYSVNLNPLLQSISLRDGWAGFVSPDVGVHFNFTNNPSLEFVCIDDAGQWYNEGEWFFMPESQFVYVDPGVAITYYCDLTPTGTYNTLTGTLTYDCGGNSSPVVGSNINLDKNSNGTVDAISSTDDAGVFTFYTTGTGILTPNVNPDYFTVTPTNFEYVFPGTGGSSNVDFCIAPNGVHPDLEVIPVVWSLPKKRIPRRAKNWNFSLKESTFRLQLTIRWAARDSSAIALNQRATLQSVRPSQTRPKSISIITRQS